jgi:AcrR family transcriptional regulator
LTDLEYSFRVLNVRSVDGDLNTEARIRNAALDLFGQHGSAAVTVRAIAEQAGVSAGLVIHHFGSKAGLIDAVDAHVIDWVASYVDELGTSTSTEEAQSLLVSMVEEPALFTYLTRTLSDGGEAWAQLYERLHQMSLDLIDSLIEQGRCREVADREMLAVSLLATDIGVMVLRSHIGRVTGVDPYSPEGMARLAAVELDINTKPLLMFPTGEADDHSS